MKIINSTNEQPLPSSVLIGLMTFKCVCIVVGVLGNLSVIIYNVFLNHDKTPTSVFVVNLAITDVFACLSIYPIWIAEFAQILNRVDADETVFCKISSPTGTLAVSLSILTLLAITLDRYIFLTWPLKYPTIMTWPRTYCLVGAIWSAALAYFPLSVLYTEEGEYRSKCYLPILLFLFCAVIYVFTPIIVIIVLNYKMFSLARDQRRKIAVNSLSSNSSTSSNSVNETRRRIARGLKTIKMFGIVIGVFLMCLTPFITAVAVEFFCRSCVPYALFIILGDLVVINSIFNPFIYGIRQKEYRNAFRRLFLAC